MQVADMHSYIADVHFNTKKKRICIFNYETNHKGKIKFWFKKHYNGIGSPTSFLWHFLDYRRTTSMEFKHIPNCSICKIKLIHNKARSSINCLQILREMSRCPQANQYRKILHENSGVGLYFPDDRFFGHTNTS